MAQPSSVVSSSGSSSESEVVDSVGTTMSHNPCSQFFSLIKMPEFPNQWQHPELSASSQRATRETKKAKEDAEIRLQEVLMSLNTVDPWDCIKAHKTYVERTGTTERQDGVGRYMKSVFDNHGMNPQECESYVTTCTQNWEKTKDDYLRSLATSIGTAHGFPDEVADALGCYMIGEVIGCVSLSGPLSMSGTTERCWKCPAHDIDNKTEPRFKDVALKRDSTESRLVFESQSRRACWLPKRGVLFLCGDIAECSPVKEALTVLNGDAKEQVLKQQGVRHNDYTERMNAARLPLDK